MKKYLLILGLFSFLCKGNDNGLSNNDFFKDEVIEESNVETGDFYESSQEFVESKSGPIAPPPLPINDYLQLLAVAAVGLGFYYRKELNQITK